MHVAVVEVCSQEYISWKRLFAKQIIWSCTPLQNWLNQEILACWARRYATDYVIWFYTFGHFFCRTNLCKRQPSQSPKASEAAHEATEPAAKGKRGSPCTTQREHENILFLFFSFLFGWRISWIGVTARAVCFYFSFLPSAHTVQYWLRGPEQDLRPHDNRNGWAWCVWNWWRCASIVQW